MKEIKYPRWIALYYESLRSAHGEIKLIFSQKDYEHTPKKFKKLIEEIHDLLYKAEEIAVKEDIKQT